MNRKIKSLAIDLVAKQLDQNFNPHKCFIKNEGSVEYYCAHNFKQHVLHSAKSFEKMPKMEFYGYIFLEPISDKEIMENFSISKESGLMTREEILWTIYQICLNYFDQLIDAGEYSIIVGYMLCDDGVVRPVDIAYDKEKKEVDCFCYNLGRWLKNDRILRKVIIS
jgi:hypothetical protein